MPQGKLSEAQENYIEFLCTPPGLRPYGGTTQGFAAANGVSDSLCAKWRRTNKTFRRELQARFKDLNTDPARVQEVVEAMFDQAAKGDTKAASLLLQMLGEFVPQSKVITESETVRSMSNEELAVELQSEADRLRAEAIMEGS